MPRKTFRVAIAAEPVSFDLEGPVSGVQNFKCRDRMGAGTLMRFAEAFSSIEDESGSTTASASEGAKVIPMIREFFNAALMPEGRERFWALINNEDDAIPLDTLVEVAGWLAEVFAGERPTGPTSSSTSAGTSTGDGSPGSPSQPDMQTYSRPELTSSST
jgi:hypothetical protein